MSPEPVTASTGRRPQVGDRLVVEAGPVAHGGHVVARVPAGEDGRELVVFVRHAIPGERVTVVVTEDDGRFLRADAVEVLTPSPDRVPAPCPYAGPGACGGCDFQHVAPAAQRALKSRVVEEQLSRLAGLERQVHVEGVPTIAPGQGRGQAPGVDGLGWRTRMQYVHLPDGRRGLRKHRSHEVVPLERCLIAGPDALEPGPGTVREQVATSQHGTREFEVAADGFWQPHVAAARTLVECVLGFVQPQAGESVLDLYAGVGLFAAFLADEVGPTGSVVAVEADRTASRHGTANLAQLPWARSVSDRVDRFLRRGVEAADLVVLDPPRAGAKRAVVRGITDLAPRAVAYVACDPAALARDVNYFHEHGYELASLRAFDLFPMTHHVECVALLTKTGSDLR